MQFPILLPNIFNYPFTYESNLNLSVGDFVEVPFGTSKKIGVVWNEFEKKNSKYVLNKRKSSNLLKGYESIRKLKNIEKKNFNTMCKGSALRYLLTRAYDYLNTPRNAIIKIKDPKEYIQKLNFHRGINSYKNYTNND